MESLVGTQTDQSDGQSPNVAASRVYNSNEAVFADPGNTIYRTIFPCNKSSSKQLLVALEPEKEFAPSITLCKPGTCGVKMNENIYLNLLQVDKKLTDFFNGASYPADFTLGSYNDGQMQAKIQLEDRHQIVLYVTKNNTKLAALVYSAYETHREVVFADATWHTIMKLSVLVKHLLGKYKSYKEAAFKMYRGLCFTVHHEVDFALEDTFEERVLMVQDFLTKRVFSIPKASPSAEPTFDAVRAFEEIKLTCAVQIMEEVAEANCV
jgi:hypothetical protein